MKALQNLVLLVAEQDFRLLRGHGAQLAELAHRRASDFADVQTSFATELNRSHVPGASFGQTDRDAQDDEARRRFARHALAALETEWARGADDRIVLVAGPDMLGTLRALIPKRLAGAVATEVAKNLVKVPTDALAGHLDDLPGV